MKSQAFVTLAACLWMGSGAGAHGSGEVDLELVLAVDVSRSMDLREQELQREGYVNAFRHPEVISAIGSGMLGRIAVTYIEWAGPGSQKIVVPWMVIDGDESANAFADRLDTQISRLRGTSISGALRFASTLFGGNGIEGMRRVIDISGDGPNNMGPAVVPVRDAVLADGVTINGLPIMLNAANDGFYSIRDLDIYYEDCVIGGPGAFLVTVESSDRFTEAIRRKLVLEIAGAEPELMPVAMLGEKPRIDCRIGERMRERWMRE